MDNVAGQSRYPADLPVCPEVVGPENEAAFWAWVRAAYPEAFAAPEDPSVWVDEEAETAGWRLGTAVIDGRVDGESLRAVTPSGLLMDVLDGLALDDPDRVDDFALLEVAAAWQRVVSAASAGLARAAAALSRRECVQVPAEPVPVGRGRRRYSTLRATGTELAIRLGCTPRTGELLARDGRLFEGALTDTGEALARGEIDPRKARIIAEHLCESPMQTALDVQSAVLPDAPLRSPGQLERDLSRALIEVDPVEAETRHTRARRRRKVYHPRPLRDGMAGIWAVLPAEDATTIDGMLADAAVAARAAGDPRTLDQLRADAFVDLLTRSPAGRAGGGRSGAGVHVDVRVDLTTLLGLDDKPADLDGYGAITAARARALAEGGRWRRIVTDPLSGAVLDVGRTRYRPPTALRDHVIARDRVCGRPGCTVPAHRAELDHTVPFGTSQPTSGPEPPDPRRQERRLGATAHDNLAPLCAADHTAKTLGVLHLEQPQPGVLEWTTAVGLPVRVIPGQETITLLPRSQAWQPHSASAGPDTGPPPF